MPILGIIDSAKSGNSTKQYIAYTANDSPYVFVYEFDNATGFGTKISNPTNVPESATYGVAFSPNNKTVSLGIDVSPRLGAWAFSASGFGTRYSNPSPVYGSGINTYFSKDGGAVFLASQGAAGSEVIAYAFTEGSGFGSKYANPTGGQSGSYGMTYQGSVQYVAGQNKTKVWAWSDSSGFGSLIGNLGNGDAGGISIHTSGSYVSRSYSGGGTDVCETYNFSGSGFGSKITSPTWGFDSGTYTVPAFNPDGTALVVAGPKSSSPASDQVLNGYPWTTTYGTKYSDPASAPAAGSSPTGSLGSYGNGVVGFNKLGSVVAIMSSYAWPAPYTAAYAFSSSTGFGTKYSNPAVSPGVLNNQLAWSN